MSYQQPKSLIEDAGRHLRREVRDDEARDSYGTTLLTLAPFLDLARELAALLVPIQPQPVFRAELHRSLVSAAQQQQIQRALLSRESSRDLRWRLNEWAELGMNELSEADRRWVVGAAVVGSALSVAGILGYVLYQRGKIAV